MYNIILMLVTLVKYKMNIYNKKIILSGGSINVEESGVQATLF